MGGGGILRERIKGLGSGSVSRDRREGVYGWDDGWLVGGGLGIGDYCC